MTINKVCRFGIESSRTWRRRPWRHGNSSIVVAGEAEPRALNNHIAIGTAEIRVDLVTGSRKLFQLLVCIN